MELAVSIIVGLILGAANLVLWSITVKGLIRKKNRWLFTMILMAKIVLLTIILWSAIFYFKLNILGLLFGLTVPIIMMIFRHRRRVTGE